MFHRNVWKAMDLVKVAEGSTMPDIGRDLLPHMAQNRILGAYQHSGKWVDLGNLHNYQKYVARYNAVWDH
jgi:NDP-sugar pyrophosphorylase family protein